MANAKGGVGRVSNALTSLTPSLASNQGYQSLTPGHHGQSIPTGRLWPLGNEHSPRTIDQPFKFNRCIQFVACSARRLISVSCRCSCLERASGIRPSSLPLPPVFCINHQHRVLSHCFCLTCLAFDSLKQNSVGILLC